MHFSIHSGSALRSSGLAFEKAHELSRNDTKPTQGLLEVGLQLHSIGDHLRGSVHSSVHRSNSGQVVDEYFGLQLHLSLLETISVSIWVYTCVF